MIAFLKEISRACRSFPERAAVVDHDGARSTDYRSLNELSGRAAAWLKSRGIGREDVVALLLPKGMEHIAARIAVMKVGAAWVSLADSMGAERVRFAVGECGCAVEFTMDCWEEAMRFEALEESAWAESAAHDLAFIIYTSGSTGVPKGAMQEYGIYERISAGTHAMLDAYMPVQFAHLIPEFFVGGIYITIALLQDGGTIHVLSPVLTRNPGALFAYFVRRGITATFVPPALAHVLQKQDGLPLRIVYVGGEIVSQVYSESFDTMNVYGPSEFGHPACLYRIDRAMDNTPIGCPLPGTETILITDAGEEAADEGILCVVLPFFRGYISEREREPFVSLKGKRWYVSGDLAQRDGSGRYSICGRTDRLININGNRIDPAEVETAVKKALPESQAAAKAFSVHGKPYLCVFYSGTEEIAAEELSERLKAYLPMYMIPSYYVKLPDLPVNSAGKLDYECLRLPETLSAAYAAPETPVEAALCRAMAKALQPDGKSPGIDDDFFALGGDSLTAMKMLMETELPGFNIACILKNRTVRQMARELRNCRKYDNQTAANGRPLPLLPMQMLYVRFGSAGTELVAQSVAAELVLKPDTDPERLARALELAVKAHSALSAVIETRDGKPVQQLRPELLAPVFAQRFSRDARDAEKAAFLAPFRADGCPLFRARLFVTERDCVLWLNAHHSICDGESLAVLVRDILAAYRGESLPYDDYRSFLLGQTTEDASQEKDRNALSEPDMAADAAAGKAGRVQQMLKADRNAVCVLAKQYGVSLSALYCSLTALALGLSEKSGRILMNWTWNGRESRESLRQVGLLIRDLAIAQQLSDSQPVSSFAAETARQREEGMLRPVGVRRDESARESVQNRRAAQLCFIHQNYLKALREEPGLLSASPMQCTEAEAEEPLELIVWENEEGDLLELQYDKGLCSEKRAQRFLDLYSAILEQLCRKPGMNVGELRRRLEENGFPVGADEGS